MKKRKLIFLFSAVAASAVIAAGLVIQTSSYLTDIERANNVITIGNVDLEILENGYEDSQLIVQGKKINKAPSIKNTGTKDEYVFVRISVPKAQITLLYEKDETVNGIFQHSEGTKIYNTPAIKEIFKIIAEKENKKTDIVGVNNPPNVVISYNKGNTDSEPKSDGWLYLEKDDTSNDYDHYYFGYNKKLVVGDSTETLFDKVQLKSFIEAEKSGDSQIKITAFGIQADNLGIDGLSDDFLNDGQITTIYNIVKNGTVN